ncbi:MAG TPA: bifunctional DNA-formamidopyrimidine glycosylase/DNA-(apurinic or apyrimidinic site) lyase [Candidatus Desulfaltia sp.]|nr:bifunctional DNA-formamidopyrimidine glycosylase/DNA-(apurinic or apyrimidinic site) lyase [Candidatus Desulfaltia sp.]
MPELPEVETIVRCLRPHLCGLQVRSVCLLFPPIVRDPVHFPLEKLIGRQVSGLRRRGKMILVDFSGGLTLIVHLKMTGQLIFCGRNAPPDKHTHFVLCFRRSPRELRFRDVRKFGFIRAVRTADAERTRELSLLGPEPLGLVRNAFLERLQGRRGRLKGLLLNQRVLAGIGNIYADEILYEAGLHPRTDVSRLGRRRLERLHAAVSKVLDEAIAYKGTTVRDFRDGLGLEGLFQNRLRVYGREGEPCRRCGGRLRRIRLSGRSTHFCPRCQRRRV